MAGFDGLNRLQSRSENFPCHGARSSLEEGDGVMSAMMSRVLTCGSHLSVRQKEKKRRGRTRGIGGLVMDWLRLRARGWKKRGWPKWARGG